MFSVFFFLSLLSVVWGLLRILLRLIILHFSTPPSPFFVLPVWRHYPTIRSIKAIHIITDRRERSTAMIGTGLEAVVS